MSLRHGLQRLSSVVGSKALATRGGGGGPLKFHDGPKKALPLWDELWWDDGLVHSQPVLDGVGEPTMYTPAQATLQLATALGLVGAAIWGAYASWGPSNTVYVPQQYPPETLEVLTSRNKVAWMPGQDPDRSKDGA